MSDAGIALETVAVTDPHDGGDKETLLHGLAKKFRLAYFLRSRWHWRTIQCLF